MAERIFKFSLTSGGGGGMVHTCKLVSAYEWFLKNFLKNFLVNYKLQCGNILPYLAMNVHLRALGPPEASF